MIKLRSLDQGVTSDVINTLDHQITGRQIWDALNRQAPDHLSYNTRTKIMNDLLNELHSERIDPGALYSQFENYKGRTIQYVGKTGVLSDVAYVGGADVYHLVIDGAIWGANKGAEIRVLPEEKEAAKAVDRFVEADELLKYYPGQETNSFVRMTMSGLFENKEQYRGYRVDFEDGPDGIFTDAWTYPGGPNWYIVVVDGVMEAIEVKTAIAIHMPRKPRQVVEKKCYVSSSPSACSSFCAGPTTATQFAPTAPSSTSASSPTWLRPIASTRPRSTSS
jgi:hypothetical protein